MPAWVSDSKYYKVVRDNQENHKAKLSYHFVIDLRT